MEELRQFTEEDIKHGFALSQFAFQYELSGDDLAERIAKSDPKQSWGVFLDGALAAKLTILPLETFIQGKAFAMGGIAGVATWPEYRRTGLVKKLLIHSLQVMKDNGQTLSYLAPFKFSFYRKYGWELYVSYQKYELTSPDHYPMAELADGQWVRGEPDFSLLNAIYEEYAVRYNGTLKRSPDWWKDRLYKYRKGSTMVYYNGDGRPRGYIYYQVKDKTVTVHEMVALDASARNAIWKLISDHDSMAEKTVLQAPMDDRLSSLVPNPRFKQETVPYFMARIVDAAGFIERYQFAPALEERSIRLRLLDPYAPWNEGHFNLCIDGNGHAELMRLEGDITTDEPLTLGIQELTTMLLGYDRPAFLADTGRITGPEQGIGELERSIPVQQTYLMDYF